MYSCRRENKFLIADPDESVLECEPRHSERSFREIDRFLFDEHSPKEDEKFIDLPTMFPSTRFYGSKRKQLSWLKSELRSIEGKTALDAFGGTGAVSHLLATLGWATTYNDIFEFNVISARALFEYSYNDVDCRYVGNFLKSVEPTIGFISNTFQGLYFTDQENMWLDGFMQKIPGLPAGVRDLLLHCLFQACLKKRPFNLFHRANLRIRTSEVPVRFGNRTTWNKPFESHVLETYREVMAFRKNRNSKVEVLPSSSVETLSKRFDLVYLDPPYFKLAKRNTETYLERYHFLEGLARYSEWPTLIDFNSKQKRIRVPYRNEWRDKFEMIANLKRVIQLHKGSKFVLSYVSDEYPTEEELFRLFSDSFDKVRLSRRFFGKALSKKDSFEILLMGW